MKVELLFQNGRAMLRLIKNIRDLWFLGALVVLAAMGYVLYTILFGFRILRHGR